MRNLKRIPSTAGRSGVPAVVPDDQPTELARIFAFDEGFVVFLPILERSYNGLYEYRAFDDIVYQTVAAARDAVMAFFDVGGVR